MTDFARARENMVNAQLMTNGIHNQALLETYRTLPREAFMDPAMSDRAYVDEDARIPGQKTFVMDPLGEARLIQEACSGPVHKALVLSAASLPSVAMLASCARDVFLLESDKATLAAAKARLSAQGIANVTAIETDYREGYVLRAPFDVVLIPGAVREVPLPLLDQLEVGGRLLCVVRDSANAPGRAVCLQRLENGHVISKIIADVSTPYLPGFEPGAEFSF